MNDKFIIERIKEGKYKLITDKEYKYIQSNEKLKKVLFEKLRACDFLIDDYNYIGDKIFKDPEMEKSFATVELLYKEKYLKADFFEELLHQKEYDEYGQEMILKFFNEYIDEVKDTLVNNPSLFDDPWLIISWDNIIDYIIENNISSFYKYIDINKIPKNRKDILEERIQQLRGVFGLEKLTNLDAIEYLCENYFAEINSGKYHTIGIDVLINREEYTDEEIHRIIELLKKYPIYPVSSRQVCRYILDNDISTHYKFLDLDLLTPKDLVKVENVFENEINKERNVKYLGIKKSSITDFNLIKDVLNDNIKWACKNISFRRLTFEQYLQIKELLIKNVNYIYSSFVYSPDKTKIARDVILSDNKELMLQIIERKICGLNEIPVEVSEGKQFYNFLKYFIECSYSKDASSFFEDYGILNNKYLVEYIVHHDEDLLPYVDLGVIDFTKENIYKLISLRREGKIDYPFINELANKSEKEIDKVIELFKERTLPENKLIIVNDALKQAIFRETHPEIKNIFANIKEKANNKNLSIEEKEKYIEELVKMFMEEDCLPKNYAQVLALKNPEMPLDGMKELVIREALHKVIIDNIFGVRLDFVHEMTNTFIAKKANRYSEEHGLDMVPGMSFTYDIKENERIVDKDLFNYLRKNHYDVLFDIVKENGYDKDSIDGPNIKVAKMVFVEWFKKEIEKTESILPDRLQFLFKDEIYINSLKRKVIYEKRDLSIKSISSCLTGKNFDVFFENVINNNEVYQKLFEIVGKYCFLEWIGAFKHECDFITGETVDDLVSYIIYFDTIYKFRNEMYLANMYSNMFEEKFYEYVEKKAKKIYQDYDDNKVDKKYQMIINEIIDKRYQFYKNMLANNNLSREEFKKDYKILIEQSLVEKLKDEFKEEFKEKYGEEILAILVKECSGNYSFPMVDIIRDTMRFDKSNIIYRYLLGFDQFALIKANPGENEASKPSDMSKREFIEERLRKNADLALKMIDYKEVTTPSFSTTLTLLNGRKIKVIVGNKTSTRNLVLGELTGSCMRAFGVGEGLYDFCATDSRGLHIIFEEPDTGKFVSRITGFRNGNTLFLNQLRESKSLKYTNSDLIEALKVICKMIIEKSFAEEKEEELPIENVIADKNYALKDEPSIAPPFDNAVVTLPSYSDVGDDNIVVLATRNGTKLSPIKIKPNGQHVYLPVRSEYRVYIEYSDNALDELNRLYVIKKCRENPEDSEYYKKLTDDSEKEMFRALIASDDWAIVLKDNLEIEVINVSSDERALDEIKEALSKMEDIKEIIIKEEGFNNDNRKSEIFR